MTLEQQKNVFLRTPKGIKAVAYAHKWFNDFSEIKLDPIFLQNFYSDSKYNNFIPTEAEKDFNDYELMFWFWFYERYNRVLTEQQIGLDLIEYRKELAEIEAANPFNMIGSFFSGFIKYAPYVIGGFLLLYAYKTFKK